MNGHFASLRLALTQASQWGTVEQAAFVEAANGLARGESHPVQTAVEANRYAQRTLEVLWSRSGPPSREARNPANPLVIWTRWEDCRERSGVGVVLQGPSRRVLILPRPSDPEALRLLGDLSVPDSRLDLIPNMETLSRSPDPRLAYVRIPDLWTSPPRPSDREAYRNFLRTAGGPPSRVAAIKTFPGPNGPLYYLEAAEDRHRALLFLQGGLDFFLGTMDSVEGRPYPDAVTLSSFPTDGPLPKKPDTIPPARYFEGIHPRFKKAAIPVQGLRALFDGDGNEVGEACLCAGGHSGKFAAGNLSAATSAGHLNYQQDGYYVCRFRLRGRPPVTVVFGADGLGGAEMGEMASSAALQGVHAAVVEALAEGRIPLPHELFEAASRALEAQIRFQEKTLRRTFADSTAPDSVGTIAVVVGRKALIASSGDFMAVHSGSREGGPLQALGYTDLDSADESMVTGTIRRNSPHLYAATMEADDSLVMGSDGFWRNLIGAFKGRGSSAIRAESGSAHPEQNLFHNLLSVLSLTPPSLAASRLLAITEGDADESVYPDFFAPDRELDNLTVLVLRSAGQEAEPDFEIPAAYGPLETVHRASQYVCDTPPHVLHLPAGLHEIFVGRAAHPEGRPSLILPDPYLAPQHIRIFRRGGQAHFEPVNGSLKPSPLLRGQRLVLSPRTSFEVDFSDSESNNPPDAPK